MKRKQKPFIKRLLEDILDLVYPRRCPVCDEIVVGRGNKTCPGCKNVFKIIGNNICMICGKEIYSLEKEYCVDCRKRMHYFRRNFACFSYQSMAQSIYRFKYSGRQEYASYYAEQIVKRYAKQIEEIHPDALIPVPLHKSKLYKRGYNQAEILAKEIGKLINVPVMTNYVERCRKTMPQKELSRENRQNNLKRAFKIKRNDVKLNTIIVIDDIYTTGSTMDMVSKVCLEAGVVRIYGICLAIGKGL